MTYGADGGTTVLPRRRRPWLRRLLIVVVVLAVLLVVLDRGADYVGERLAADNLQSSQHLPSRPDVSIEGVPFLTQFASGDYPHVVVDVHALPVGGGAVTVSDLHVDLNDLTVSHSFSTFHVRSATAVATVSYADLSKRLGVTVAYAGDGRVRAGTTLSVPGLGSVSPTISVQPALANGALTFGRAALNGAGSDLGVVATALNKIFDVTIPLDGLPFDISVRSLTVDQDGLHAAFVGSDLTYRKG